MPGKAWSAAEDNWFWNIGLPMSHYATGESVKGSGLNWKELAVVMQRELDASGESRRQYNDDMLFQKWNRNFSDNAWNRSVANPLYTAARRRGDPSTAGRATVIGNPSPPPARRRPAAIIDTGLQTKSMSSIYSTTYNEEIKNDKEEDEVAVPSRRKITSSSRILLPPRGPERAAASSSKISVNEITKENDKAVNKVTDKKEYVSKASDDDEDDIFVRGSRKFIIPKKQKGGTSVPSSPAKRKARRVLTDSEDEPDTEYPYAIPPTEPGFKHKKSRQ